jgi:hypothetical protein
LANLVILTADQFKALNPLERQAARRAARQQPLVRLILRTLLQRGESIPVEDLSRPRLRVRGRRSTMPSSLSMMMT